MEGGAAVDLQDDGGRTPLMAACKESMPHVVRFLLECEADTTFKDAKGRVFQLYDGNTIYVVKN